jgi:hypothetical protein
MKENQVKEYDFFEVMKGLKKGKKYLTKQHDSVGYIYYDKDDKIIKFYHLATNTPYTYYISTSAIAQKYTLYKGTAKSYCLTKTEVLTKKEKDYLSTVIAPIRNDIKCIKCIKTFEGPKLLVITYYLPDLDKCGERCLYDLIFPASLTKDKESFKGLELYKEYSLAELYL